MSKDAQDGKKDASYDLKGGNIFCTQKIVQNNTNLKPYSPIIKAPLPPIFASRSIEEEVVSKPPVAQPHQIKIHDDEEKKVEIEQTPLEDKNDAEMNEEDAEEEKRMREEELQKIREREEELRKDHRMRRFMEMTEEEKDLITCDEVFSLYLRHVSKYVNESYYRQILRFVLLYRECLNEYGWLKRRDHYQKAGILEQDLILNKLREAEEYEEERQKQERIAILRAQGIEPTEELEEKKIKKPSKKKEQQQPKETSE